MKTVFLVQHGQSHHHVNPEARLWPDARNGLTDEGRRQARRVAARLRMDIGQRPCQVYASRMRRAVETAEIIGHELGGPPGAVSGLQEYNGRFAIERTSDGEEWVIDDSDWSLFDWRPFPEAETWREFHVRVAEAMDHLGQQIFEGMLPVLVLHGGTLSNIIVWWLGIPLDVLPERTCFAATPGSISVLKKNRYGNPVIDVLNDRAHLTDTDGQNVAPNHGMQPTS